MKSSKRWNLNFIISITLIISSFKLSELKSLINSQQEFALAIKNVLKSLEEDLFDPNTDGEKDEDETETEHQDPK